MLNSKIDKKYLEIVKAMSKNALFKDMDENSLCEVLRGIDISIRSYEKDETLFHEGDPCVNLGFVIEGGIELQNIYPSGRMTVVTRLGTGNTFGEAILFTSKSSYPITVVSVSKTKIVYFKRTDVIELLKLSPKALENYLTILSNRLVMLNKKIKVLSMATLREKICDFLITEHKRQGKLELSLSISKREMAERMAVQRPSLSREFINMERDGLISLGKKSVVITDLERIEDEIAK